MIIINKILEKKYTNLDVNQHIIVCIFLPNKKLYPECDFKMFSLKILELFQNDENSVENSPKKRNYVEIKAQSIFRQNCN